MPGQAEGITNTKTDGFLTTNSLGESTPEERTSYGKTRVKQMYAKRHITHIMVLQ